MLITAYTDFQYLLEITKVYTERFDCYIHVDKKSKMPADVEKALKENSRVVLISEYKVNWGSFNHILAVVKLLEIAAEKQYDYYHIISANSCMVKSMQEMEEFFAKNPDRNYIQVNDLEQSENPKMLEHWYRYYHFCNMINKKNKLGYYIDYYLTELQKKFKVRRDVYFRYKGMLYCHLSGGFVAYVRKYLAENSDYLEKFKYCNIGEEFFFQNIIMNSEFKETVSNGNLIFDKWNEEGKALFLKVDDYEELIESNCLFARKVGSESEEILQKLRQH